MNPYHTPELDTEPASSLSPFLDQLSPHLNQYTPPATPQGGFEHLPYFPFPTTPILDQPHIGAYHSRLLDPNLTLTLAPALPVSPLSDLFSPLSPLKPSLSIDRRTTMDLTRMTHGVLGGNNGAARAGNRWGGMESHRGDSRVGEMGPDISRDQWRENVAVAGSPLAGMREHDQARLGPSGPTFPSYGWNSHSHLPPLQSSYVDQPPHQRPNSRNATTPNYPVQQEFRAPPLHTRPSSHHPVPHFQARPPSYPPIQTVNSSLYDTSWPSVPARTHASTPYDPHSTLPTKNGYSTRHAPPHVAPHIHPQPFGASVFGYANPHSLHPTYYQAAYPSLTQPTNDQYRPYPYQTPTTPSQHQFPPYIATSTSGGDSQIPTPLSISNTTSRSASALPSPAYTQTSLEYPYTPLVQTFPPLSQASQTGQSGWGKSMTIPMSVLTSSSGGLRPNEEDRGRRGSFTASLESTDDGLSQGAGYGQSELRSVNSTGGSVRESGGSPSVQYSSQERASISARGSEYEDDDEDAIGEIEEVVEPIIHVVYTDDADIKQTAFIRRQCNNCQDREAPSWRRSKLYARKILCNKCGLYETVQRVPRPLNVKSGVQPGSKVKKTTKITIKKGKIAAPASSSSSKSTSGDAGYKGKMPKLLKLTPKKMGRGGRRKASEKEEEEEEGEVISSATPKTCSASTTSNPVRSPTPPPGKAPHSAKFPTFHQPPLDAHRSQVLYPAHISESVTSNHRRDSTSTSTSGIQTPQTTSTSNSLWSISSGSHPASAGLPGFSTTTMYSHHGRSVSASAQPSTSTSSSVPNGDKRSNVGPYPPRRSTVTHNYTGALRGSSTLNQSSVNGTSVGQYGVLRPSYMNDPPTSIEMDREIGGSGDSSESSLLPTPGEELGEFRYDVQKKEGTRGYGIEGGASASGLGLGVGLELGAGLGEMGKGMKRDEEYVASWMMNDR